MKKLILAIITVIAFFFVLGSAGALENETITMFQCVVQCMIAAIVEAIALKYLED
jgi:hypothetical protein